MDSSGPPGKGRSQSWLCGSGVHRARVAAWTGRGSRGAAGLGLPMHTPPTAAQVPSSGLTLPRKGEEEPGALSLGDRIHPLLRNSSKCL